MISDLQSLLSETLQGIGISDVVPLVSATSDSSHGDYATNVAFVLAKKHGISPMDAASRLANELTKDMPPSLSKVEVARPGFVNLTLSQAFLIDHLKSVALQMELPLKAVSFAGKKIMIEFTDPNPFKEFHIGHLYSNIVGESISRILEANGAEVRRVCYQGDVGLHVAKALWGLQQKIRDQRSEIRDLENKSLDERAKFLGEAYALGASKYEEDSVAKEEIIKINKMVYDKDTEIMPLYEKGRQWSLEYFETIYSRLGTKFVDYYFESEAGPRGVDLVKQYKDTVFEESNGAVIFPGEKYGLHTRVFINSLGLPTYEAKELGLAVTKYEDYPFDSSIVITGNEIDEYFRVLLKALSLIRPEIAAKMKHLSHGMVRLPEGKMSSRTGNVKTGEWLLDEAVSRAKEKIKEGKGESVKGKEETPELHPSPLTLDPSQVAELVGVGAVKWALLKSGIGKDIEFSFDESVSFEGNSGPYLQYTFVRTQSVLTKGGSGKGQGESKKTSSPFTLDALSLTSEERRLLVLLCQYSDIVVSAAERFSPSDITTYLFDLAQAFNNFYQKHQILKPQRGDSLDRGAHKGLLPGKGVSPENEEPTREFRLQLTAVVGQTIKDGLLLLGIKSPERM